MTLVQFGYWFFGLGWLVLFVLIYREICAWIDERAACARELEPVIRSGAIRQVK